jgi:hypothetical protein
MLRERNAPERSGNNNTTQNNTNDDTQKNFCRESNFYRVERKKKKQKSESRERTHVSQSRETRVAGEKAIRAKPKFTFCEQRVVHESALNGRRGETVIYGVVRGSFKGESEHDRGFIEAVL